MARKYRHLFYNGQCQMEALKKNGISAGAIGQQLDRDGATISV